MPKVLRVLNRLNVGGPTYNVAYLSRYLDAQYQTKVLTGIKDPDEGSSEYMLQDLGIPYEFVPNMHRSISPGKDWRAFKYIQNAVNAYQPDIVHTHAAKAGVLGRLAAHHSAKRPKAIIHTYHGNVFDGYFSPLKTRFFLAIERYLASISDAIVAISDQQKHDLVNKYHIAPASKIKVIRLGFDLDKFTRDTDAKRSSFRNFYQLQPDEVVITITGRLAPIKNHNLFIDALQLLKTNNPDLKFKAFVVGDGELMEPILSRVAGAGLTVCKAGDTNYNADIIFTSWRKDIDVINAGSDIIALTSLNEGTPVSIIEAMASQKGVICTNVGGVKDVVKDGVSGFLSTLNAVEYAQKLEELSVNKQVRDRMAAAGKAFVMQSYSYQRLVTETEDLYRILLDKNI
jgi:glycosyltransferase involved in cell wall biosynthesis